MHANVFLLLASPFVGSFLGLAAYRMPRGLQWVTGRSRCPSCGRQVTWPHLVPIAGWFLSGGRCARCAAPIDPAYPAIEAGAVLVALWSLDPRAELAPWVLAPVGWTLLLASAIDLRHFLLPDILTLPLTASGLLVAAAFMPDALSHHVIGAGLGYAIAWAGAILYRRLRGRAGLGLGDAKLLAAAGAWIAWSGLPSVLLIASVGGLLFVGVLWSTGRRIDGSTALPFGPFLALGMWIVLLYGPVVPLI